MREDLWRSIHELKAQGLSKRAISRRLSVHRRTVRDALKHVDGPPKVMIGRRGSIIDSHRGWLLAKLEQYPELKATRLFDMLKERGYEGGYSLVKQTVAGLRPRLKPVYQSLHFEPGECAQVDWGCWQSLDVPGGRRRLSFFTMVLCHSRMLYAELFLGEKTEHWLQAHRNAFEFFGGVPAKVMVDNCKTAVLRARKPGQMPVINPDYQQFANHYGFRIAPCNAYCPNEKGRVENAVGYIKTAFLAGRRPTSTDALNPALKQWLSTANARPHGATRKQPAVVFENEERSKLKPLPAGPHACARVKTVIANSVCRVNIDANRYSVGPDFGSRRLVLHRHVDHIRLFTVEGDFVAQHRRSYDKGRLVIDPEHEQQLNSRTRHKREEVELTAFLNLGHGARDYLDGLREKRPNYRSHVKAINALAQVYSPQDVVRAMADACCHHVYSADWVQNILQARSRTDNTPGPLHVTRRGDLLGLDIPTPNLDIYTKDNS